MKKSDTITKVAPALVKAQAEINHALKDGKNPHLKNQYATLESVIDALKPAFNKHDLSVIQTPALIEGQHVLETYIMHSSGEFISGIVPLLIERNNMQGLGSAITYARRYGLAALLNISQTDDDGNEASKSAPKEKPKVVAPKNEAPKTNAEKVLKAFAAFNVSKGEIEARYGKALEKLDANDIAELRDISQILKNNQGTKAEFFGDKKGA